MSNLSQALSSDTLSRPEGRLTRLCRRVLFRALQPISDGVLEICEAGRKSVFGEPDSPLRVTLQVHCPDFYRKALLGGSIGAAEAYISGDWTCNDLVALVRIFARNESQLSGLDFRKWRLPALIERIRHGFRRNTRSGSRRNIAAHYDLGNDFFSLFLDSSMTYSCGVFESAESTLLQASRAKYDRLCRKLDLRSTDHVLEIGSGWGGFALHAAGHYGCRVTTTTISPSQHQWALQLIQQRGLTDRVEILLQDYRDLSGRYDMLVSIEMIEAVGHDFLDTYFSKCSNLLKEDGLLALQAITIADRYYERAKNSVDFIQSHVFPGSALPSLSSICNSLSRTGDLRVMDLEDITIHYPRTLREWRRRFLSRLPQVRALGYSEEFVRLWEFYLCYCEGGFLENHIGDVQMILARPGFSGGIACR